MLNYALVPLHTRVLHQQQDYGVLGELYAYASFLNIIFLYGMETAFFRFASKNKDLKGYYSNAFTSVCISTLLFTSALIIFAGPLLGILQAGSSSAGLYSSDYVIYFALIIGLDAIS